MNQKFFLGIFIAVFLLTVVSAELTIETIPGYGAAYWDCVDAGWDDKHEVDAIDGPLDNSHFSQYRNDFDCWPEFEIRSHAIHSCLTWGGLRTFDLYEPCTIPVGTDFWETCEGSQEPNYFVNDEIKIGVNNLNPDRCINDSFDLVTSSDNIMEFNCRGDLLFFVAYNCQCEDGVCLDNDKLCTDTDQSDQYPLGLNPGIKGTTVLRGAPVEDYCYTAELPNTILGVSTFNRTNFCSGDNCYVFENTCHLNAIGGRGYSCPEGCYDGACGVSYGGCYVGQIDSVNQKYCDVNLDWVNLSSEGDVCLNSYECAGDSCVDGLCQSRFPDMSEKTSLIWDIWAAIRGWECNPEDQSYWCDGTVASLCGLNYVLESKGEIEGECGYTPPGPGPNPSGCSPYWKCSNWSNYVAEYDTDCGYRTCFDDNGCNRNSGKPITYLACPGSGDADPYCGDGFCKGIEDYNNCQEDCAGHCGDGICDPTESSASCSIDGCYEEPNDNPDYLWLFILLIIILLIAIGIITYFLFKKFHDNEKANQKGGGRKAPPKGPPRNVPVRSFRRPPVRRPAPLRRPPVRK